MDTLVDNRIKRFTEPLKQTPDFNSGILGSARAAGQEIREKIGTPLAEGALDLQKWSMERFTKGIEKISPSTYIEPRLTEGGFPSGLTFAIGLAADIITPFPGDDMARIKKFIEPLTGAAKVYRETGGLTTRVLKDLEGRSTVSKQYIMDATNRGDLKQVERDLIRQALEHEGDVINVSQFAEKVKAELLPLKRTNAKTDIDEYTSRRGTNYGQRYEGITLPKEIRGNVANYTENIYESPIKTSAGNVHFDGAEGSKNYFGHTRIEDMADNKTRRVIEVQSDLYQKGNLEREALDIHNITRPQFEKGLSPEDVAKYREAYRVNSEEYTVPLSSKEATPEYKAKITKARDTIDSLEQKSYKVLQTPRGQELAKLQQYNDPTAHFRMIREEVKKAAEDGKTKLQFPTGETAMKIEGLGERTTYLNPSNKVKGISQELKIDELKPGLEIQERGAYSNRWIITDVLGDGKFKAVEKSRYDSFTKGTFKENYGDKTAMERLNQASETFDISGKVDTENPIYKFYEKDLGRYLTNKYGAKRIVDKQGVAWYEIDIKPDMATQPVEAFGKIQTGALIAGAAIGGAAVVGQMGNTTTYTKQEEPPQQKEKHADIKSEIAFRESGISDNPYNATNTNSNGTRDIGKYQVNEKTLESYGKKFLGKDVDPETFLASPALQETFFEKAIDHLQKLGAKSLESILILWHKGWGDISTARINELKKDPGVVQYLNNKPK